MVKTIALLALNKIAGLFGFEVVSKGSTEQLKTLAFALCRAGYATSKIARGRTSEGWMDLYRNIIYFGKFYTEEEILKAISPVKPTKTSLMGVTSASK